MTGPERFQTLPEYAFPRLRRLLDGIAPGGDPITMTIGEPRHPMPAFLGQTLAENLDGFALYPPNEGAPELMSAISAWLQHRYGVSIPQDRLIALNGTREGLFNACLALCPEAKNGQRPVVLMPNPFYQVYAAAALAVGAEPVYVPATAATGFLPDFAALPRDILNRTAVAYLCSPANPQGAVVSLDHWADLLALAEAHDFRIFADECYSEVWRHAAPPGILQAVAATGADPERALAFHSLSKRSNMPGLRSGFAAGGIDAITRLRQLRAFAGAPLPLPLQRVSAVAWADEAHVDASRALYRAKFDAADAIFSGVQAYRAPEGGFFLWLPVQDGEAATTRLWRETGVKVLPGAYLGRDVGGENPGQGYIRVALVASQEETQRGLTALRDCLYA